MRAESFGFFHHLFRRRCPFTVRVVDDEEHGCTKRSLLVTVLFHHALSFQYGLWFDLEAEDGVEVAVVVRPFHHQVHGTIEVLSLGGFTNGPYVCASTIVVRVFVSLFVRQRSGHRVLHRLFHRHTT